MKTIYSDIRERIAEEPSWYDENGAPRYGKFTPRQCPDIYANVVVLMKVACQFCEEQFQVQMSSGWSTFHKLPPRRWCYGDPPIHDCVGDTMSCDGVVVLEVWKRDKFEWEQHSELEGLHLDYFDYKEEEME